MRRSRDSFLNASKTQKLRARQQAGYPVIRADVTVVLEVRQSIVDGVLRKGRILARPGTPLDDLGPLRYTLKWTDGSDQGLIPDRFSPRISPRCCTGVQDVGPLLRFKVLFIDTWGAASIPPKHPPPGSATGSDQNLIDPLNFTRHGLPKSFYRVAHTKNYHTKKIEN